MNGQAIFEAFLSVANAVKPRKDGDYDVNGILHCGNCHTPKQHKETVFGNTYLCPINCKCEQEHYDRIEAERKEREWQEKISALRRDAFPSPKLHNWSFANDDGNQPQIVNALKRYVENFPEFREKGTGLLLHGKVGSGKTYAACEVVNALIDKGYPCFFTNMAYVINKIQSSFEGRNEFFAKIRQYALVVIDDFGMESNSDFRNEITFQFIDTCVQANVPMIVTTNLDIEDIKNPSDGVKSRIYDRLLRCFPIKIMNGSKRRTEVWESFNTTKDMLGL